MLPLVLVLLIYIAVPGVAEAKPDQQQFPGRMKREFGNAQPNEPVARDIPDRPVKRGKRDRREIVNRLVSCEFSCKEGDEPNPPKDFVPVVDGCHLTDALHFESTFDGLEQCCEEHDRCYQTCHLDDPNGKKTCDDAFQACAVETCADPNLHEKTRTSAEKPDRETLNPRFNKRLDRGLADQCATEARGLLEAPYTVHCYHYRQSQAQACGCEPDDVDRLLPHGAVTDDMGVNASDQEEMKSRNDERRARKQEESERRKAAKAAGEDPQAAKLDEKASYERDLSGWARKLSNVGSRVRKLYDRVAKQAQSRKDKEEL